MTSNDIYTQLCQSKKSNKSLYKKGSGLHEHHILPRHSGGLDVDENYTYLTVREHIIAHYLLWRIHKNPQDLRSMKMLGANLSVAYRRIIGLWCVENKIGIHSDSITQEQRSEWREKGQNTQKESGSKDSFYYWSTSEGRSERASKGGKATIESGNAIEFDYWRSSEGQLERASMGGKALKGYECVTNGTHRTRIIPELLEEYLNKGYRKGFTLF
jgi:hypothetical protein